jgi:hypothetical protein
MRTVQLKERRKVQPNVVLPYGLKSPRYGLIPLTEEEKNSLPNYDHPPKYRIVALQSFVSSRGLVKQWSLGGYVDDWVNLDQSGNGWIYSGGIVLDSFNVQKSAIVSSTGYCFGGGLACEHAVIAGVVRNMIVSDATINSSAKIIGVKDSNGIHSWSEISNGAVIGSNTTIDATAGRVRITGDVEIGFPFDGTDRRRVTIGGNVTIFAIQKSQIRGNVTIDGQVTITPHFDISTGYPDSGASVFLAGVGLYGYTVITPIKKCYAVTSPGYKHGEMFTLADFRPYPDLQSPMKLTPRDICSCGPLFLNGLLESPVNPCFFRLTNRKETIIVLQLTVVDRGISTYACGPKVSGRGSSEIERYIEEAMRKNSADAKVLASCYHALRDRWKLNCPVK